MASGSSESKELTRIPRASGIRSATASMASRPCGRSATLSGGAPWNVRTVETASAKVAARVEGRARKTASPAAPEGKKKYAGMASSAATPSAPAQNMSSTSALADGSERRRSRSGALAARRKPSIRVKASSSVSGGGGGGSPEFGGVS
nr:unnamed protein product [Digitaria exilis]